MKVMHIVGARPNFMKVAPIMSAMAQHDGKFEQVLVHTGQHYDRAMSDVFFEDLGLCQPDHFLNVGSGSHASQTAKIMLAFELVLAQERPDWLLVVGDVNSTLACTLVASKLGVRVAHVEAGLRSRDRTMPEEINRIVTDSLSDLLLTPSRDANENLLAEGVTADRIVFVGNVMIDSLIQALPNANAKATLEKHGLSPKDYVLATLHRPSNVDDPTMFQELIEALSEIAQECPVLLPLHPRTRDRLETTTQRLNPNLHIIEPLGYLEFLGVMHSARLVISDSGGIQEETTFLQVPCLTVRPNTERPITITGGTNRLVTPGRDHLLTEWQNARSYQPDGSRCPELWDGHAADRIVTEFLRRSGTP